MIIDLSEGRGAVIGQDMPGQIFIHAVETSKIRALCNCGDLAGSIYPERTHPPRAKFDGSVGLGGTTELGTRVEWRIDGQALSQSSLEHDFWVTSAYPYASTKEPLVDGAYVMKWASSVWHVRILEDQNNRCIWLSLSREKKNKQDAQVTIEVRDYDMQNITPGPIEERVSPFVLCESIDEFINVGRAHRDFLAEGTPRDLALGPHVFDEINFEITHLAQPRPSRIIARCAKCAFGIKLPVAILGSEFDTLTPSAIQYLRDKLNGKEPQHRPTAWDMIGNDDA